MYERNSAWVTTATGYGVPFMREKCFEQECNRPLTKNAAISATNERILVECREGTISGAGVCRPGLVLRAERRALSKVFAILWRDNSGRSSLWE